MSREKPVPRLRLKHKRLVVFPELTIAEFADLLAVHKLHVIAIEQGRRNPSPDLMMRWMELLPGMTMTAFKPFSSIGLRAFRKAVKAAKAAEAVEAA